MPSRIDTFAVHARLALDPATWSRVPRRVLVIALAGALLASAAAVTPAAAAGSTRYLSTTGNDNSAGSRAHPWRSFYTALGRLRPGDRLLIRAGSYTFGGQHYTRMAGTATAPILIAAYPGERPVFTGTTTPASFLYFRGNSAHVTLRGITIKGGGATSSGSSLLGFIENANHIRIEGVRLIAGSSWATNQHLAYVASSSVNDITFKANRFDGRNCACAGLIHFYHDPNAARVQIAGNVFENADQAIVIWARASGLVIRSNTFVSTRIAVRHHQSGGTTVANNTGIRVRIGIYADSTANLTRYGNRW